MFMITWSMIETVATHSSAAPYLAVSAGPISHSPLPIEVPRRIAPGPMTRIALRSEKGGGAGRSDFSQAGRLRVSVAIAFPSSHEHRAPYLCWGAPRGGLTTYTMQ